MIKTVNLSGEQKVSFAAKHIYFWVQNLSTSEVLMSTESGVADSKDNVLIVPVGGAGYVHSGIGTNDVYLSGNGKVQVYATDNAFCPFKPVQKGGDEVTVSGSAEVSTVEYPVIGLNIYGASTQEGTPTPDAPAEIISVGDDGTINVEIESGMIGNAAKITSGLPLCGIDDVCDELIYNADGTGKIVKRFGRVIVTANQITGVTVNQGLGNFFYTNIVGAIGENSDIKPLCNRFVGVTFADRATAAYLNDFRCFMGQDGRLILRNSAADNRFTTVAEMQSFIEENETVVIYPLATVQEIELSATEMAELQALRTFNGLTTISNDKDAEMSVKVAANLLLSEFVLPVINGITARFEARIAALESAVTNT